jgi:hypothetical protein
MAKLNTGTRIYGTANVDTSIYVGTSNTTTGTGGILANNTTLFIGNTSGSTTIDNGGVVAPNLISTNYIQRTGTFSADVNSVSIYQPFYMNGTSPGTAGYILASNGTGGPPVWRDTVRVNSQTTATSVTIDGTAYDSYVFTALGTALTFNASTLATNGEKVIIRIKDDGTARALTWTGVSESPRTTAGAFRQIGLTLPTTTVVNKILYVGLVYNTDATPAVWDAIAYTIEA